jgi:hypothetical protein
LVSFFDSRETGANFQNIGPVPIRQFQFLDKAPEDVVKFIVIPDCALLLIARKTRNQTC